MKKKTFDIIARVQKRKALGIIFNVPKEDEALLHNKLADQKNIVFKGSDVYTSAMLNFRLSNKLKLKDVSIDMLPSLIDGKMIVITGADIIKISYEKVFEELASYKIPVLLIMNKEQKLIALRKTKTYTKLFTIEQDYTTIKSGR